VAVPRGGKVTIAPRGPESLDLSLAELDPTKGLEPLRGRGLLEAPPPVESVGSFTWAGFSARRPSNAEAFESKQRPLIRVARHFVEAESPAAVPLLVHFTLPAGPRVESDGRSFVGVGATFRAELGVRRPLLIPMRVLGEAGTKLELRLAPGRGPKRAAAGIFDRVTLPRTVIVGPGPTRATLVVGDDVPAGPVTLEVVVLPRTPERQAGAAPLAGSVAPLFVHLPWATRHPPLPRWIAGQFEE